MSVDDLVKNATARSNLFADKSFSLSNFIAITVMQIDPKTGTSDWALIADISKALQSRDLAPCDANGSHLFGENSGLGRFFDIKMEYQGNRKFRVCAMGWKQDDPNRKESLPAHLIAYAQDSECAHCASTTKIEADHKHGRTPFPNIYSHDDVQGLCRSHNAMKREYCKSCEANDERFDARDFGYAAGWLIGGSSWDEAHNKNGQHGCVGCYWFDPTKFKYLISQNYQGE